jgi:hypothetical protein
MKTRIIAVIAALTLTFALLTSCSGSTSLGIPEFEASGDGVAIAVEETQTPPTATADVAKQGDTDEATVDYPLASGWGLASVQLSPNSVHKDFLNQFFYDQDNTLRRNKNNGYEPIKIAENAPNGSVAFWDIGSMMFYLTEGGDLYSVRDTSAKLESDKRSGIETGVPTDEPYKILEGVQYFSSFNKYEELYAITEDGLWTWGKESYVPELYAPDVADVLRKGNWGIQSNTNQEMLLLTNNGTVVLQRNGVSIPLLYNVVETYFNTNDFYYFLSDNSLWKMDDCEIMLAIADDTNALNQYIVNHTEKN